MLFRRELERWRGRFDLEVEVTVDGAEADWHGNVGVVTELISRARFDPENTVALVCGPEIMMRFTVQELIEREVPPENHLRLDGAQHEVRHRALRPLPVRAGLRLQGRAGLPLHRSRADDADPGAVMSVRRKPKLAVWKFASCDGCQLSLLDCEDELLALAGAVEIAYFLEASRARVRGPYDLSLVEGSITTPHDAERIHKVRKVSSRLITIGACATAGGIQALRNFAGVGDYISAVYAHPDYIDTLDRSTPIADHVPVDFELRGCPVNKEQLLEVISACWPAGGRTSPRTASASSASGAGNSA